MDRAVLCFFLATIHFGDSAYLVKTGPNFPYSAWPSNVITYRLDDPSFTNDELTSLNNAMRKINEDTGGCITFRQDGTTGPSNVPFVQIQRQMPTGGNNAMCWTYPGYHRGQDGRNTGQLAVMFGPGIAGRPGNDEGSCLGSGKDREAMALLVNILGLYNEYQREDRETGAPPPMIFSAASDTDRNSLVKDSLKSKFIFGPANRVTSLNGTYMSAFDPFSVTMITPEKYSKMASRPVFTTNRVVGTQATLSVDDCNALMSLYSRYCPAPTYPRTGSQYRQNCNTPDPYSSATSGPVFLPKMPAPATVTRNIQCADPATSATTPATSTIAPLVLATLPLDTLFPAAQTDRLTVTLKSPISGLDLLVEPGSNAARPLGVFLSAINTAGGYGFAPCVPGTAPAGSPAGTPAPPLSCHYTVNFILKSRPTKGISATATVQVTPPAASPGATVTPYSVPIQIELNCAPRLESVTANVGLIPNAVQPKVFKVGNGLVEITPTPNTPGGYIGAQIVQAASGAPLANYLVNYAVDFTNGAVLGSSGTVGAATNGAPPGAVDKVFVHCIAAAPAVQLAGTNVVAIIHTNDPEMDDISYYTHTGVTATSTTGEVYSVTTDGVVTMSGLTLPSGTETAGATPTTLANAIAPAAAGGYSGSIDAYTAGAPGAGGAPATAGGGTKTRDITVVAVDSKGASTVIHLRFLLGCGQVPF